MGDYDAHHAWHSDSWWYEHHPHWVETHHPEWAKNGDWDEHHHNIGMTATGGKPTTLNGRTIFTPTGSSVKSSASRTF
jgi:hypothetical protein